MDSIELALDRDRWQVLVNTMMNFWVPQSADNFLSPLITVKYGKIIG